MYCSNCGKKISNGSKYCPHCGAKVGTVIEEKPLAAYVVKDPSLQFHKAEKLIRNTLALGILELIIVLGLIFILIAIAIPANSGNADVVLASIGSVFVECCGIAEFVLIIIVWTRWSAIKNHTNVSYLWATVGYSVSMGVSFILSIVLIILLSMPNQSIGGIIGVYIIEMLINIFNVFISFYLHNKIKLTIHK